MNEGCCYVPSELWRRTARVGADAGDGHGLALVVGAHGVADEETAGVADLGRRRRDYQQKEEELIILASCSAIWLQFGAKASLPTFSGPQTLRT